MMGRSSALGALSLVVLCLCGRATCGEKDKKPFFEGYELLQKGFVAEAVPFFEQAIATDPGHAPAYSKLADCHEILGEYEKAAPLWNTYVTLRPNLAERIKKHLELLNTFVETEKLLAEEAHAAAGTTRDTGSEGAGSDDVEPEDAEPSPMPAPAARSCCPSGAAVCVVIAPEAAAAPSREAEPAVPSLSATIDANLLKVAADTYRGSCIAEKAILILIPRLLGRDDFPTALIQVRRVAQEFPKSMTPRMHLWWGTSLRGTGAWFEAIRVLTLAEDMFRDDPVAQKDVRRELARAHLGIARDALAEGAHDRARQVLLLIRSKYLSVLTPAESLFVQNAMVGSERDKVAEWIAQGDAYANQSLYEDAIRWYSKVRELTYSNRFTLEAEKRIRVLEERGEESLAKVRDLVLKKRFGDAMGVCESVEKAFPKDFRIRAMQAYAEAAMAAQQTDVAAKKLLELAEKYPTDEQGIMAYAQVGYLYGITAKQPDKGLGVFQKMLTWQPEDSRSRREALLGNGIMLALLGKKEEATRILTAVAVEFKDNARVTKLCRDYIWKCKNCNEIAL